MTRDINGLNISKTTLQGKEFVKPSFIKNDWLRTPAGQQELKKIHTKLSSDFGRVRMFMQDNGSVMIAFGTSNGHFEIIFNNDFPNSLPEVYHVNENGKYKIEPNLEGVKKIKVLEFIYEQIKN